MQLPRHHLYCTETCVHISPFPYHPPSSSAHAPDDQSHSPTLPPNNNPLPTHTSTPGNDAARGCPETSHAPRIEFSIEEDPFGVAITHGGSTIFNSTGLRLVFKEQYLELSTAVNPSATLFGAGERTSRTLHLARNGAPRPLWNRDIGPTLDEQNSYGSHPWVLGLEQGESWGRRGRRIKSEGVGGCKRGSAGAGWPARTGCLDACRALLTLPPSSALSGSVVRRHGSAP